MRGGWAGARLGARFAAILFPPTCWSTAEDTFCRDIVPSHVLEHGWGHVLPRYCSLSRAGARLGHDLPRYCSLPRAGARLRTFCLNYVPWYELSVLILVVRCVSVQRKTRARLLSCTLLSDNRLRCKFDCRSVRKGLHISHSICTLRQCTTKHTRRAAFLYTALGQQAKMHV